MPRRGWADVDVPARVAEVLKTLRGGGFQAYLVGGCVRDALLGRRPKDWDVATDARPQQTLALFPEAVPTGIQYGTVTVPGDPPTEVTTFRKELAYVDARRPVAVAFSADIEEDLARRDFTINAIAWDPAADVWVDPYGGRDDLKARRIRSVGDPGERIREDALRMLRAVRFAAQLQFEIDPETWRAIERHGALVSKLSQERVRDEFLALLEAPGAEGGLWQLQELGLLTQILPELRGSGRMAQGKPGAPTLLAHLIQTVGFCPADPILRLAALLHDVGKLKTRKLLPSGRVVFHGHEEAGAAMADEACRRLRLPNRQRIRVVALVAAHMVDGLSVGKKALRRWLGERGEEWIRDLIALRRADALGSGRFEKNAAMDRMERLLGEVLEEASALRIEDLAIDGHDVMRVLEIPPGPMVGRVLQALFEMVLEDPSLNQRPALLERLPEAAEAAGAASGD